MHKETIKYTDYNDVEREEDFYFNLTKAELMNMELSTSGGLATKIKKIIESKDVPSIQAAFIEIIKKAYGVKSDDGRRFIKNEQVLNDFIETEAYSELYMRLATDEAYAAKFINSIVPKDVAKQMDKADLNKMLQ